MSTNTSCVKSKFLTTSGQETQTLYVGKRPVNPKHCASSLCAERGSQANPVETLKEAFDLIEQGHPATLIEMARGDYTSGVRGQDVLKVPSRVQTINGNGSKIPPLSFGGIGQGSKSDHTSSSTLCDFETQALSYAVEQVGKSSITGHTELNLQNVNFQSLKADLREGFGANFKFTMNGGRGHTFDFAVGHNNFASAFFNDVIVDDLLDGVNSPLKEAAVFKVRTSDGSKLGLNINGGTFNTPDRNFSDVRTNGSSEYNEIKNNVSRVSNGARFRIEDDSKYGSQTTGGDHNVKVDHKDTESPMQLIVRDRGQVSYSGTNNRTQFIPKDGEMMWNGGSNASLIKHVLKDNSNVNHTENGTQIINKLENLLYDATTSDNAKFTRSSIGKNIETRGPLVDEKVKDNATVNKRSTNCKYTRPNDETIGNLPIPFVSRKFSGFARTTWDTTNEYKTANMASEVPLTKKTVRDNANYQNRNQGDVSERGSVPGNVVEHIVQGNAQSEHTGALFTADGNIETTVKGDAQSQATMTTSKVKNFVHTTEGSGTIRDTIANSELEGILADGKVKVALSGSRVQGPHHKHLVQIKGGAEVAAATSKFGHVKDEAKPELPPASTIKIGAQGDENPSKGTFHAVEAVKEKVDESDNSSLMEVNDKSQAGISGSSLRSETNGPPFQLNGPESKISIGTCNINHPSPTAIGATHPDGPPVQNGSNAITGSSSSDRLATPLAANFTGR